MLIFAPFAHISGMGGMLGGLSDGRSIIFMPRFDFGAYVKLIAENQVHGNNLAGILVHADALSNVDVDDDVRRLDRDWTIDYIVTGP